MNDQLDLANYRGIFFDLDGVVWLGTHVIPGAPEALSAVRASGKIIRFITNNASQYRAHYIEKLGSMGIEAELDEIFTSGFATARYLAQHNGPSKVHVMGTENLKREMREAGHELVDSGADMVVVGYDREFNWERLDQAFENIYRGARFVVCNADPRYPEKDRPRPGTGCQVAALATCVGRKPDVHVGKPELPIMEMVIESTGLAPAHCLMIGDKVDTDIHGGAKAGTDTLMVLSGDGKREDGDRLGVQPDFIMDSIAELIPLL